MSEQVDEGSGDSRPDSIPHLNFSDVAAIGASFQKVKKHRRKMKHKTFGTFERR